MWMVKRKRGKEEQKDIEEKPGMKNNTPSHRTTGV
jgi:hypothetical protein